jgi:hypothetical protein
VKEAATKLLALYPEEPTKADAAQMQKDVETDVAQPEAQQVQQQQHQQQQQVEVEKAVEEKEPIDEATREEEEQVVGVPSTEQVEVPSVAALAAATESIQNFLKTLC